MMIACQMMRPALARAASVIIRGVGKAAARIRRRIRKKKIQTDLDSRFIAARFSV
jgi:hypothetical protein